MKNNEVLQMARNAQNHIARAHEGLELLKQGKPLILRTSTQIGFEPDEIVTRRTDVLNHLKEQPKDKLRKELSELENSIISREKTDVVGTSELNWRRNAIKILLGEL